MEKFNGVKIAETIIQKLKNQEKQQKIFAAILVGENPASLSFLKQKEKVAKELGVDFRIYKFPENIKNDDLRKEVGKIALLKKVGGVIVQLPLPEHLNKHYILNVIPREKDVDVLGERALGAFYAGRNPVLPPSVGVVEEILKSYDLNLKSLKVAVVGAGFLIGKPIAIWLMDNPEGKPSASYGARVKELSVFKNGSDLSELKNFDLVISGVGQAGLIKPEMLKEGAGVIDFGYNMKEIRNEKGEIRNEIYGDFDPSLISHLSSLSFYTPTPNGTGPILVAKIFENFYKLNQPLKQ